MSIKQKYFKAFIRVVKSLNPDSYGFAENIVREPVILAEDKDHVKLYLLNKYPQFFQNNKVYEKETKDSAQFFYVVIFPLYQHEINMINEGEWKCSSCGQIHLDKYTDRPKMNDRLFGDLMFCKSEGDDCFNNYKKEYYKDIEFPDDEFYIKKDSPNYIYKITEKSTNKSYIGKTRNAPFFRWWNHLAHSSSPFGLYLRQTMLSDWTFEVLIILPPELTDSKVFKIESEYIIQYNAIENGFNTLISNKKVIY